MLPGPRASLANGRRSGQERRTYIDRANEVLAAREEVSEKYSKQHSHNPCANKTLNRLLGRQLDELGAPKGNTADVGPDVVCNHQRSREEEPNHTLKDVVHDEMSLHNNQVQCHMRPGKVGKLELVVSSLERHDEEDKAEYI